MPFLLNGDDQGATQLPAWDATGDDGADKAEAIDAADAFRRFKSALTF